jgi:hypothetical protein
VKTLATHILPCLELSENTCCTYPSLSRNYPANPIYSRERGTCLGMLSTVEFR